MAICFEALFGLCGVFHVADMSDMRSRSNSTLPLQWTVCGCFQRPLKENQIEYFLRIMVLDQKTLHAGFSYEPQAKGILGA